MNNKNSTSNQMSSTWSTGEQQPHADQKSLEYQTTQESRHGDSQYR